MSALIQAKELQRKNTVTLASRLLGKVLVRRRADGSVTRHVITETEAYHSEQDLACHASKGRTPRTEVLYRAGGCWYIYLCYGIHEMLNLVVGPENFPAAILIRGLHDVIGPGRLTKALDVNRQINGLPAELSTGLWLEDDGIVVPKGWIKATPRIGVDYAGPIWSAKPWRFTFDRARLGPAGRPVSLVPRIP
jgi:DNA-3-methyladenine glycosylase